MGLDPVQTAGWKLFKIKHVVDCGALGVLVTESNDQSGRRVIGLCPGGVSLDRVGRGHHLCIRCRVFCGRHLLEMEGEPVPERSTGSRSVDEIHVDGGGAGNHWP